jgi:RND family efflux transporter MFP subunit
MKEGIMKARVFWGLALVLATVACGGPQKGEGKKTEKVQARLAVAERTTRGETQSLFATVEAEKQAAVSSRVMASVLAVRVKVGDRVRKGQVLVDIDPDTAKGQVVQARGALAQAQAALALAERNYQRFKALYEAKAASQLELDMAQMQYEQAKGAVEQAQGAVQAASSVAKESQVVAPFAGYVVAKLVEAGDLAAPGRPLVVLESAEGRRMVATVPERVWAANPLQLGQKLTVILDSQPEKALSGQVVELSPSADPATHSFTLKVALEGESVPAGTAGRVLLPLPPRPAVMVPREAVLQVGGLTLVVVRDPEGKARSQVVTLGAQEGNLVEVLSGLKGGEQVLLGLAQPPADGALVEEV